MKFLSTPRGKFAGKPVLFPEMLDRRRYFVPVHAFIWLAVVATFVAALSGSNVRAESLPASPKLLAR